MAGFITAEGLVVAAGGDTYDYVNDQRRLAGSIRSVSAAADRAGADVIAAAMSTDGRPVSATNPLVVFNQATRSLEWKDNSGWVGTNRRYAEFTSTFNISGGSVAWDLGPFTKDASSSTDSAFVDVTGAASGAVVFRETGIYAISSYSIPPGSMGNFLVAQTYSGGGLLTIGSTTGYAWDVATSTVALVQSGANVRFTCSAVTAQNNVASRLRIAKLMGL